MCDPKNHRHVVYHVYPGSGALTFDMSEMAKRMENDKHESRAISCECGAVEIGYYKLWREKMTLFHEQQGSERRIRL